MVGRPRNKAKFEAKSELDVAVSFGERERSQCTWCCECTKLLS